MLEPPDLRDVRRAAVIAIAVSAIVAPGCTPEDRSPGFDSAPAAAGTSRMKRALLEGRYRCPSLKEQYEQARVGSAECERDEDCQVEPRGKVYTALDGCLRLTSRKFDGAPADRIAQEWLDTGCADEFALCAPSLGTGACRSGVCMERPPPPVAEDWSRFDVAETFSLFLPPEIIEVPFSRSCGNGPAVRLFGGPGLHIRVEFGYELSRLPLADAPSEYDYAPPRAVVRTKRKVGPYEAIQLSFERPDINSRARSPDGSWPSYQPVRALAVQNIDAPYTGSWLGMGSGPVSMSITVEGERAREPVVEHILEWVSFW